MKKGFTLVELLSVFVVLGIIATITVPKIIDIMNEGKKRYVLENTEKLVRKIEEYKSIYELANNRVFKDVTLPIVNSSISGIDIDAKIPNSGEISIDNDGKISLYVYDMGYCAVKNITDNNVQVFKADESECNYTLRS